MEIQGNTWLYMVIYGNTWLYMVIHGYTWQYMVTLGEMANVFGTFVLNNPLFNLKISDYF